MAGSKSDYLENRALDCVLGVPGQYLNNKSSVYIALSTAAYSDAATGSSMSEVPTAGTSYTRVQVPNDLTNWPAASGGQKSNGAVFTFPAASAAWGTILSFYIVDAATGGNVLYGADLTTQRTIATGDTASFAVGSIVITES